MDKISSRKTRAMARITLANAVNAGRLVRPDRCGICGGTGVIHGHHADYAEPLSVIWVCRACHGRLHAKPAPPPPEDVVRAALAAIGRKGGASGT